MESPEEHLTSEWMDPWDAGLGHNQSLNTVWCCYNTSIFSKILTLDTPYLTREGEVWSVFCESKIWFIFCVSQCNGVWNVILS